MNPAPTLKIKLQILCGDEIAMGPGKADLLDAIASHGSISAAAKAMGMSYRRAWLLVDVMNRCWQDRLVITTPGGAQGSGAKVSELGQSVLNLYRSLQATAHHALATPDWEALEALAIPRPRPVGS